MSVLYITEYSSLAQSPDSTAIAQEPNNGDQNITFTTTTQSAAFKNNTKFVRLHPDGICSVAFGTNPTATTANRRMIAGQTEYFQVPLGAAYKVAVVTNT